MSKFQLLRMTQGTIDEYLEKGYWNKKVLSDFLDQHTADMPDREAIVDSKGRYTFKELNQLVNRVAQSEAINGIRFF